MLILAVLLSLAPSVRAAEMPSVFEAHYADSIERSLSADSFFASELALSFDGHLAAGALAAPMQFNRVASRLEELKPGLGRRLIRSVHDAAREARFPPMMRALEQIAGSLRLESLISDYDSRGKAVALFDGGQSR
ncbi:MAG TPA: hypothetical protein VNK24_06590 [Elusimicrobiota bacterium]|nr:hypothetical protein [Elusimicrobiota bacterium]